VKTKRLAIILSVFSLLVVIVVLCSTVFTISSVELKFYNTPVKLSALTDEKLAQAGKFNYSESVFIASKKLYTKNIEESIPYIKVIQIETVFPNKLRVCVAEREEIFAISRSGGYVICDSEFKVLSTGVGSFVPRWDKPILITNLGTSALGDYVSGSFIADGGFAGMDKLGALEGAFYACGFETPDLLALIKSVHIAGKNLVLVTHDGVEILLHDAGLRLSYKVSMAITVLEALTSAQRVTGQIVVFTDPDTNKLAGTYI